MLQIKLWWWAILLLGGCSGLTILSVEALILIPYSHPTDRSSSSQCSFPWYIVELFLWEIVELKVAYDLCWLPACDKPQHSYHDLLCNLLNILIPGSSPATNIQLFARQQDCHVRINYIMNTDPSTYFKTTLIILRLKERALYFLLEKIL